MRQTRLVVPFLLLAACAEPTDPAGWARAAGKRNRVPEKLEALQRVRQVPGDRKAAVPWLVALLRETPRVRAEAAELLGEFGDAEAAKPLIAAIDVSGTAERQVEVNEANRKIATALGALRVREAVPALIGLTRSRDGFTQVAAVDALGDIGDPAAVEPLAALARDDGVDPFASKKALQALGKIGDPRPTRTILEMLYRERRGASFFPEAALAAYLVGPPMVDPLLRVLRAEDRELLAWARGNGVVEGALYAKAAQVLGDLGDARAIPALVARLSYRDRMPEVEILVRVYAAESLGRLRAREAVRPLGELLLSERNPDARDRYADALARIGDRAAIPALARACRVGGWEEHSGAAQALSRIGGEGEKGEVAAAARAAPPAEAARLRARLAAAAECREDLACWTRKLGDKDPGVRDRAALEVGRRGGAAQAEALVAAATLPVDGDEDLAGRYHAVLALGWVTARGVPGGAALAGKLQAVVERERARNFTAKVNEDLERLAMRLRRAR